MEKRFLLFIVLSIAVLIGNLYLQAVLHPPKPPADKAGDLAAQKQGAGEKAGAPADEAGGNKGDKEEAKSEDAGTKLGAEKPKEAPAVDVAEAPEAKPQWFTLGSADPNESNPYRLLVTATSKGAAIERIETSSAKYRDFEDRSGYLGHLAAENAAGGIKINVVGTGTPAAVAGLKAGDVITSFAGRSIADVSELDDALAATKPDQKIEIAILARWPASNRLGHHGTPSAGNRPARIRHR